MHEKYNKTKYHNSKLIPHLIHHELVDYWMLVSWNRSVSLDYHKYRINSSQWNTTVLPILVIINKRYWHNNVLVPIRLVHWLIVPVSKIVYMLAMGAVTWSTESEAAFVDLASRSSMERVANSLAMAMAWSNVRWSDADIGFTYNRII